MPPLLQRLSERKPESLDYLGVSYGLTPQLLRFWKRAGYIPLYIRQTQSELTGEHTCVMVRGLNNSTETELEWLGEFANDFRRRFLSLLSYKFREFGSVMGLSILEAANAGIKGDGNGTHATALTTQELSLLMTPYDLKRLESYANNMLDYHVIIDILPIISALFFGKRLGDVSLSAVQASILLGMGLQRKSVEELEKELSLPVSQTLALFVKLIRKITKKLQGIQREALGADIPPVPPSSLSRVVSNINAEGTEGTDGDTWKPINTGIEEELDEAGDEATRVLRERQRAMFEALDLSQYAIDDSAKDWSAAEAQATRLATGEKGSTVVSVRSTAPVRQKRKTESTEGNGEKTRKGKKTKRS